MVKTIPTFDGNWSQFDDDMEVEVPSFDVFGVLSDQIIGTQAYDRR